jgi:hypothetical protein
MFTKNHDKIQGPTQASYKVYSATNKPRQASSRAKQNLATFSCEVFGKKCCQMMQLSVS